MDDRLNSARALRVAEIINDYRTLLVHISQMYTETPREAHSDDALATMRECHAAAQSLLSSNYSPTALPAQGSAAVMERAELQSVILDSSARRFQAHKIYLRAAAARRCVLTRTSILRGQRPAAHHAPQLKSVVTAFRQELSQITDQHVYSDLRAADLRAGHWVEEDPSLNAILRWVQSSQSLNVTPQ